MKIKKNIVSDYLVKELKSKTKDPYKHIGKQIVDTIGADASANGLVHAQFGRENGEIINILVTKILKTTFLTQALEAFIFSY